MIHNQTRPGLKKELPQPAASWLGIRKKPVPSVLGENLPSLMGEWAAGHRPPVPPAPNTGTGGVPYPREVSGCSGGSSGEGIIRSSVWAALQTGSAKGVLHKHLILLLMLLSLLVFNQVMDGCWCWLNSDSIHGVFGDNQVFFRMMQFPD